MLNCAALLLFSITCGHYANPFDAKPNPFDVKPNPFGTPAEAFVLKGRAPNPFDVEPGYDRQGVYFEAEAVRMINAFIERTALVP
jgi:hypothetical protein